MKRIALVFALLLIGAPYFASAEPRQCNPTGTWYGGSDWKFVWTVTPNGDGTYTAESDEIYELEPWGYTNGSDWTAHIVRRGRRDFEQQGIAMFSLPTEVPGASPATAMEIVHSTLHLKDGCNTMVSTIDVYGAFMPWKEGKVPFVTDVDLDFLNGTTIVETYHRMKQLK